MSNKEDVDLLWRCTRCNASYHPDTTCRTNITYTVHFIEAREDEKIEAEIKKEGA